MKKNKLALITLIVLFFQILFVESLTINATRPDFLVLFIIYITISNGRLIGLTMGFTIGLISDLSGVGSYFGLSPLSLSITAYLSGFLYLKYERLLPYVFHSIWIIILILHFYIITYFRFQSVFLSSKTEFFVIWIMTFGYTFIFFIFIQYFFPLREASHVKISK
ncbi:MAG: rod shape-determining protein MreD [Candidatus Neomarinimicrobiota bacterium]|nr:rod shape-determining protein MreD [Candidatus Neomarinimicrobiota bacterium]